MYSCHFIIALAMYTLTVIIRRRLLPVGGYCSECDTCTVGPSPEWSGLHRVKIRMFLNVPSNAVLHWRLWGRGKGSERRFFGCYSTTSD